MSSVSCSICCELVTSTCIASNLTCGHVYHNDCLDNWLKTTKTCPDCRNGVIRKKRIYLNLVPDPAIEKLTQDLAIATTKLEIEKIANQLQATTTKHLEEQLSDKDELAGAKQNDEVKSNSDNMLLQNKKLKLELQLQEKQEILLNNEITELRDQLQASKTENIEITKATAAFKEDMCVQVTQLLHSRSLHLNERLNRIRGMFEATDAKLQVQLEENRVVKMERDSLLKRNTQLNKRLKILKLQSDRAFLRKIKRKYERLVKSSSLKSQSRKRNNDNNNEFGMTEEQLACFNSAD